MRETRGEPSAAKLLAPNAVAVLGWVARTASDGPRTRILVTHSPHRSVPPGSFTHVLLTPVDAADIPVAVFLELVRAGAAVHLDNASARAAEAAALLRALGQPGALTWGPVGPEPEPGREEGCRKGCGSSPTVTTIDWDNPPLERRLLLRAAGRGRSGAPLFTAARPSTHESQWGYSALEAFLSEAADASACVSGRQETDAEFARIPRTGMRLKAGACAGSGQCVRVCPTGALSIANDVTAFSLDLNGAACIECGLCIDYCPEGALRLNDDATWGDGSRRRMRVGTRKRCTKCGMSHGGSDDLCAVCAFRAANPTGVRLPPGFVRPRDRT